MTPDQEKHLIELLAKGLGPGEIARQMNVSRNVIAGKLHRMRKQGMVITIKPKPKPKPEPAYGPPRPNTFFELGHDDCRYPLNDSWPFEFCPNKAFNHTSWCQAHYKQVFSPHYYSRRR
jgi:hypothetical protein